MFRGPLTGMNVNRKSYLQKALPEQLLLPRLFVLSEAVLASFYELGTLLRSL